VAFDVIETLFSLAPVAEELTRLDVGLDLFFARVLRDGFALAASGSYRPFAEIATAALGALAPDASTEARDDVLAAFRRLPAHPDADPALQALVDAGVSVVALTNGSADTTTELFEQAGLDRYVARVIGVGEAGAWKPAPTPYRHLVELLHRERGEVALVAVHAWDVHGASRAGLVTGWCSRLERRYPPIFDPPDVSADDLPGVAEALLALET
jgi:2-haloacid dehalogenase